MPQLLVDVGHDIDVARIHQMKDLLARLGVFGGGIDVDIDPDFDGEEVDYAGIKSGVMLLMDHLLAVAEGARSSST